MSPYGKDVHWPERFPLYDLVDQNEHMVWETPNPRWWVPRGYALVRADTRGTGKSPGRLDLYGPKDAEDFYDVIEWAADAAVVDRQGRVQRDLLAGDDGLAGRRAAAAAPGRRGGVGGADRLLPRGRLPGRAVLQRVHRVLVDAADRAAAQRRRGRGLARASCLAIRCSTSTTRVRNTDLDRVTVPLLSAGNWGALHLHLRGNVEGWRRAASEHKWLVVHTGTHIDPYYADWAQELQLRFLDRFLKGRDDRMDGVAPVRLAIRHGRQVDWRDETDFPLARTQWRELYLADGARLAWEPPTDEATVRYPARFETAPADEPLELTGPVALRLWISAEPEDLDVLARLQHLDADGEPIPAHRPAGRPGADGDRLAARLAPRARPGALRAVPPVAHRTANLQPLPPGEPTLLEVEIWPTSITLAPGERLRLELVGDDTDLVPMAHSAPWDRRPARRRHRPPRRRSTPRTCWCRSCPPTRRTPHHYSRGVPRRSVGRGHRACSNWRSSRWCSG